MQQAFHFCSHCAEVWFAKDAFLGVELGDPQQKNKLAADAELEQRVHFGYG